MDVGASLLIELQSLRAVFMNQQENHPHLLRSAKRHEHQKVLSLLTKLRFHGDIFRLILFFFLLKIVFGLGLRNFNGCLSDSHWILFMRPPALVRRILDFDKRHIITNHLLCHFLELFRLLIDPLSKNENTMSGLLYALQLSQTS